MGLWDERLPAAGGKMDADGRGNKKTSAFIGGPNFSAFIRESKYSSASTCAGVASREY